MISFQDFLNESPERPIKIIDYINQFEKLAAKYKANPEKPYVETRKEYLSTVYHACMKALTPQITKNEFLSKVNIILMGDLASYYANFHSKRACPDKWCKDAKAFFS